MTRDANPPHPTSISSGPGVATPQSAAQPRELHSVRQTGRCVVGARPAGAMLALLLARQAVPVTVLEARGGFEALAARRKIADADTVAGRFRCSVPISATGSATHPPRRRFEDIDGVYFFTIDGGRDVATTVQPPSPGCRRRHALKRLRLPRSRSGS